MMSKRVLLSLTFFAAAAAAAPAVHAQDAAAGTSGASFMKIGIGSPRALAMGRAYVALAEGSEAMTWNPAGLALTQQREFAYSYLRYIQEIDSPVFMAYAHPLGRTVFGANLGYITIDGFEVRDGNGVPLNGTEARVQNGFFTLSAARSFWYEKLFFGASLKAIHEDNDGTIHDTIVGDFGALLKPNSYVTFGFATQNFGSGNSRVASVTRGGASVRLFELLTISMELSNASDSSARLGLGAEFMLPEDLLQVGQVYLRVGFHSTDDLGRVLEDDRSGLYPLVGSPKLSFGVGLFTAQAFGYGIAFDYALVSLGSLGTADMLSLKMKF
ncbi:MAG: hypothetical protein COB53_00755 [Elusimicrobia bacterium]|nr:MAG: hypothetical protein COB53_00755 [Elusimicrobiota bacterium]